LTIRSILASNQEKPSGFFYGYFIIIACFFILFAVGGIVSSFGVFLKPVLSEFGWSRASISGTYALNLVFGGFMGILAGRLGDRFNPRLALTIGGLFIGPGILLMSQVHSILQIYVFYGILVSAGIGFVPIPILSMIARWFMKGRGLASGIALSGVGVGMVVVPPLANLLISEYNWRTSYLILGLSALFIIVFFAQFLKRAPVKSPLTDAGRTRNIDSPNPPDRSQSVREAVSTHKFWIIITMGFFFFYGIQTVNAHIAAHASDIGYSSAAAATILSVIGFVNIGSTILGGSLGDKIGTRKAMIIIFALTSISFLGFRFSNQLWLLYLWALLFGLGSGGFSAVQSPFTADYFGLKNLGVIFSFFILAQNIGGGLGSLIAGGIFDISGSYQWAFLICAILCLTSLFLSILLKSPRKKWQQDFKTSPTK
jgi:OFA family oxalate/formate antiporter-like MFS transporter